MPSVFTYLNNREIGTKPRPGLKASDLRLNLDYQLSNLVCCRKNIYTSHGEYHLEEVPPFSCKFRRDSMCDLLAVANEDGVISLYDTTTPASDGNLKSFTAHRNAVYDICWLPDKGQLISGSGDHCAVLWDMSCSKLLSVFKKHTASVRSVDVCHEQSALFASGSRDGSINVWDTRESRSVINSKSAISIGYAHCRKNPISIPKKHFHPQSAVSSVSCVAFQGCNNLASAGVADGVVKIWDLRRTYVVNPKYLLPAPKYILPYAETKITGHGCTSLVFDSLYQNLYGCSTSSKIFKFDCHSYSKNVYAAMTYNPQNSIIRTISDPKLCGLKGVYVVTYEGLRCTTYFVTLALSNDDQYLLSGSSDDKAYIWKTSKPGLPILKLPGHAAEVTAVCWSPYDITKLATCGDDNKVSIWKIANTEGIDKNDIAAVAEPYSKSSENVSTSYQDINQNSVIISNTVTSKSKELTSTPSKPAVTVITNFFSPVPTSPLTVQPCQGSTSLDTSNSSCDDSINVLCEIQNKSLPPESPPLTLYSKANANNNWSSDENLYKNHTPEQKNVGLQNSSADQNKENGQSDTSPEISNGTNSNGQIKRKITSKQSTSNSKRKQSEGSKKLKRTPKSDKKQKTTTGKTIMNYFSILSPDN